jgi:hypothetical protein
MGPCRLLAVLAVALTFGLSACGGDNDPAGEPPTTAPPDPADTRPVSPEEGNFPADFVEQADPICAQALTEVDKQSQQEIDDEAALGEVSKVYGDAATELEGLEPPEANATAYGRLTDSFREGADLFSRLQDEAGGDSSVYQRVPSTIDEANTNIKDLANQFGFTECAGT